MICGSQIHGKSGAPSLFLRLRSAVVVFANRPLLSNFVQGTYRICRSFEAMRICSSFELRCEFLFHSSCVVADLLLFLFFHQGMNDQQGTPTQGPPHVHGVHGTHGTHATATATATEITHRNHKSPTESTHQGTHPPAAPPSHQGTHRRHPPKHRRHPPKAPTEGTHRRHPPKAPTSSTTITDPPRHPPAKAPTSQGAHQGTHQGTCTSLYIVRPQRFS
jgi:hypothetical protein